jgi:hypothetical protein
MSLKTRFRRRGGGISDIFKILLVGWYNIILSIFAALAIFGVKIDIFCQKSFPENCSEVSHGKTARPTFFSSFSTLLNLSGYLYAEYGQSGHYRTP